MLCVRVLCLECVRRITKFLQAVEEEEEMLGGENTASEDELEICDYQSGTEQSGDESEDGVSEDELEICDYQSGTEQSGDESEDGVSEDELEICDYQSGTEQSGDESEDGVGEDELPLYDRLCTIFGKDGTTKWKTIPPPQNSRTVV